MRPDLKAAYRRTVRTADRVLSADKLLVADLRHDNAANAAIDAGIMAALIRTWIADLKNYRDTADELWKEVDAQIAATVPAGQVHAAHAGRGA
jgi:hypothetical protein